VSDIDSSYTEFTPEEKGGLDYWQSRIELVLATGRPCCDELQFWLKPMGFKVSSAGTLSLPWSAQASTSPWNRIGSYFFAWSYEFWGRNLLNDPGYTNWRNRGGLPNLSYILRTTARDFSGITALMAAYPNGRGYIELLNSLYDRVFAALNEDIAYLSTHILGFNIDHIIAGLLILFDLFLARTAWRSDAYGYHYFYIPSANINSNFNWANGTVGPYTVAVYFCENGVIRAVDFDLPLPEYSICHQSIDADILLQDEAQVELAASQLLSAKVPSELDADEVLQARVDTEFSAELPLQGEVQLTPNARLALRDKVMTSLDADEWLAATHQSPFDAAERLAAIPRIPLDADICIQGPVPLSITARMLLEPDFESEMLTDLERLHIQKYRIVADPRAYVEYNSEKDPEVIP